MDPQTSRVLTAIHHYWRSLLSTKMRQLINGEPVRSPSTFQIMLNRYKIRAVKKVVEVQGSSLLHKKRTAKSVPCKRNPSILKTHIKRVQAQVASRVIKILLTWAWVVEVEWIVSHQSEAILKYSESSTRHLIWSSKKAWSSWVMTICSWWLPSIVNSIKDFSKKMKIVRNPRW